MAVDDDRSRSSDALAQFHSLVEDADRKFALVRDLPLCARGPLHLLYFRKAFKSYTRLWRFQQRRRRELVAEGLCRWEIGEVAYRIGQLFYCQYQRTSETRFLVEAYVFYEAVVSRGYFEAVRQSTAPASAPDLRLKYKELRFLVRFLIVALLLNRNDEVRQLADRFRSLVEESKAAFPAMNFKEWKQVIQEIARFLKADALIQIARPLRYNILFDAHQSSFPCISRFHSTRVLRLKDALLTSYHRNEIKLAELTLDTFRMLQCLEWEPNGFFNQNPKQEQCAKSSGEQNEVSGLIDINVAADMTDPDASPNPRKAVIYRPSVSHLIAVIATIWEELSSDEILLIYISASGKPDSNVTLQRNGFRRSLNSSKVNHTSHAPWERETQSYPPSVDDNVNSTANLGTCLCLGSQGNGGSNDLYPEDLVPFTRKPLFLILDSDNSQSFKAIHGAERGEASALLLSHEKPFSVSDTDISFGGSQFTHFLTSPLQAFFQLVDLSSGIDSDLYNDAESLLSSGLAEWEVALCTSSSLNQVWAQVLADPFLRRLIVRFIFCRAVLSLCRSSGIDRPTSLPECLPSLPDCVDPNSTRVQIHIQLLAARTGVSNHFDFL